MGDAGANRVECIIPILSVRSLTASVRFYVDVLGFGIDWGDSEGSHMASVSRDGHAIMLCQDDERESVSLVWVGVEDIEPLAKHCRALGVKFLEEPTNHPWAFEMEIEDPDGHVLRFGSEPRTEQR
jgi:predicted lactoylglutathione lyase